MITIVGTNLEVGPDSMQITCPTCHSMVQTTVKRESTNSTHLWALVLCILCCPLVWLPYFCNSCQDANHYCPKCNTFIGSYKH
ncbi:lipopolysaccharide-induced tumor necrosis factor-alpha factor homolog [Anopheles nili]|uniref:lipopolysaccharide-induced tumor necrosis factor-alpha factor homolog n=1 Tax=Anopheles nili TaxID=185578 RepID=UPI00237C0A4F|nr:lipopolysaccharide-induced tumor necrosis factor-alpha factor homolog [Anopheles nili]